MSEFKKEDRYLVIKRSDIEKFLTYSEKEDLYQLAEVVRDGRAILTSKPLECVVVESSWPIYNDVWKMVEANTLRHPTELNLLRKEREIFEIESIEDIDVVGEEILCFDG
ncbi:hypothetical protein [Vibrio sp. TBV020]|uniref:hypothetical protein n=1 Tax=Vibrio sp. TBV020 TaxID=3137398 RepID=UPI0038CDBFF8